MEVTRREVLRRRGVLPTSGSDPGEVRGLVLLELKGMNRGLPGSCAHGLWMDGLTVPWFPGSQVPRLSRQGPTEVKVSIWDPKEDSSWAWSAVLGTHQWGGGPLPDIGYR